MELFQFPPRSSFPRMRTAISMELFQFPPRSSFPRMRTAISMELFQVPGIGCYRVYSPHRVSA
uniref:Uncharacterized protein n=1 Tax=Picea glauca TaxID=3330 RepID=A0A101LXB7_PICGL|nr:hypothetical protein ABT39_MTgene6077 [Picea glauca]